MKKLIITLFCILIIYHTFGQSTYTKDNQAKVLLITGSELSKHAVSLVKPSFYKMLFEYEDILWDHATSIEDILSSKIDDKYDVIIMFSYYSDLSSNAKYNLNKFLESGKGLIAFHSQLASFDKWDWWGKEVTGGRYQYTPSNKYKLSSSKRPVTITLQKAQEHPITNDINDFEITDEVYNNLTYSDQIKPLFITDSDKCDKNIIWIGPHQKSRIVVFAPGHGPDIYSNENFKEIFYRSILWAGHKL